MTTSKSLVLAASFKVLAFFGCSGASSSSFRSQTRRAFVSTLRTWPRAKTKCLWEIRQALESMESAFVQANEPNLKYKTKFKEYKEPEYGTVGTISLQGHERPNHSFKRTPDGAA